MPKYVVHIITPTDIIYGDESMLGDVKLSGDLKNDYLYDIIHKVEGKLILVGSTAKKLIELDTSTLRYEPCSVIIYKVVNGVNVQAARGTFSLLESDFDVDKCVVRAKITSKDYYQDYEIGKGKEYNLFDVIPNYNDRYFIAYGSPIVQLPNGIPVKDALLWLYRKINPSGLVSTPPFLLYKYYNLTLYQKSDIIRRNIVGFSPATNLPMTFEKLINDLCKLFNLVWRINAQGNLIIDYRANMSQSAPFDLTQPIRLQQIYHKGTYGYNSQKVFKREQYIGKENKNLDFIGAPIEYNNGLVNALVKDNEQKITVELITDLPYLLTLDPLDDAIDYDGVVLVAGIGSVGVGVHTETTILDTIDRVNNVLSWALLHNDNHKTDRVFKTGVMNNTPTTFTSVQRTKEQKGVQFKVCNTDYVDFNSGIITQFGTGKVSKYSHKLATGEVTCDLLFEPTETVIIATEKGLNKLYPSFQDVTFLQGAQDGLLEDSANQITLSGQMVAQSILSNYGAQVTINADGSFTYIPVYGYYGTDTFQAIYQDTNGYYSLCTITMVVQLAMVFVQQYDTNNCQSNPQNGNQQWYANWFADSSGTIPIDVTGYTFDLEYGGGAQVAASGIVQKYYDYYCDGNNYSIDPSSVNRYTII